MSSYANYPVPQAGEEVVAFSPFVFENDLNPIYFRQHLPAAELMEIESTSEESLHNDLPEDSEEPLEPTTPAPQDAPTPPTPSSAASPTWSPSAASTPASWPSPASEPSSTSTSPPTSPASQTSYTCADCDESFRLRGELNRHRNRKHIKRFRCSTPGCDAAFHLKTDLARHQQSMRCGAGDAVRLCCEFDGCAKTFSRKDNLDRHVWEKHQHGSRKGKR